MRAILISRLQTDGSLRESDSGAIYNKDHSSFDDRVGKVISVSAGLSSQDFIVDRNLDSFAPLIPSETNPRACSLSIITE